MLRWFQYLMFKTGITDNNLCSFCQMLTETVEHILWEYVQSHELWIKIINMIKSKRGQILNLDLEKKFRTVIEAHKNYINNIIILKAKNYVYNTQVKICIKYEYFP